MYSSRVATTRASTSYSASTVGNAGIGHALIPQSSRTSTRSSYFEADSTTPRPSTSWSRPATAATARSRGRPKTIASTLTGDQQLVCAISESRGLAPVVGLAFVNFSTAEAILCQISDSQTYVKTEHKLAVIEPTEILFMSTAAQPETKLYSFIKDRFVGAQVTVVDRKYWAETTGMEFVHQLVIREDLEALKVSVEGNYYAICCFAAVLKYVEYTIHYSFSPHSLRIKYENSEGAMMIDLSTIRSLELIQNLQDTKSKDCLFGLINHTWTPMGSRLLKSNLLQPSTDGDVLKKRWDAVKELSVKEEIFFAVRQALKAFVDVDRILTAISLIPTKPSIQLSEQSINNVIILKQFIKSIPPIHEALTAATSSLLQIISGSCAPQKYAVVQELIDEVIDDRVTYQKRPLDLRNQRTFAVKAGNNGLLDVARQTYKEANADAVQHVTNLGEAHELILEIKYDPPRQYFIRLAASELEDRNLPEIFINVFRRKKMIECQTLDLLKINQKIVDSHHEVLQLSDNTVQELIDNVRAEIAPLFKISDAIALLDVMASFAHVSTAQDYCRPEVARAVAIKNGRHPIQEKVDTEKHIPNDCFADSTKRFQIITGCNMSGKSTYIRSIALMAVMAQCGSFVPASFANLPIFHQLFARISIDDNIQANVSTFSAEMRETAFILRNVDKRSLVIIDELGRGTSTRDGLCIAIAVAEALVQSKACVWFATHFRDISTILAERAGVISLHLSVEMGEVDKMKMLYRVANGAVQKEHYGIALAKVVNLPPEVIKRAEVVSKKINANTERWKKASKTLLIARRRRLMLHLREQLLQAREGNMQGETLRVWMKDLQDAFVRAMSDIDEKIKAAEEESDDDKGQDDVMDEASTMEDVVMSQSSDGPVTGDDGQGYLMTGALQSETGDEDSQSAVD